MPALAFALSPRGATSLRRTTASATRTSLSRLAALRVELEDRYAIAPCRTHWTSMRCAARARPRRRTDAGELHHARGRRDRHRPALLEHPSASRCTARSLPGARLARGREHVSGAPLSRRAAACSSSTPHAPEGFPVDLLLSPVLAMQREFVRACGVDRDRWPRPAAHRQERLGQDHDRLTLAPRGHGYLGDDMAVLHAESASLLPLRAREPAPGPHPRSPPRTSRRAGGTCRIRTAAAAAPARHRAFPDSATTRAAVARCSCAVAGTPAIEPFDASVESLSLPPLGLNKALWLAWGTTPQRRLLQFMLFMRLLARLRCAWLDVGDIETTADLIEQTMEDSWH
jgi:hypothetical protein